MASNVYRRGAIYWWRRNLTFRNPTPHPITIRMSLKTAAPDDARARAAVLEARVEDVKAMLRSVPRIEDFKAMARRVFDRALDRYVLAQLTYPQASEQHAKANLAYARYFALLAASPNSVGATEELRERLRQQGLSEHEVDQLWMIARTHEAQPALSPRHLFHDLEGIGLQPTDKNAQIMLRVVAAAHAQACIKATEAMGMPSQAEEAFALPPALIPLFPDYVAPPSSNAGPTSSMEAPKPAPRPGRRDPIHARDEGPVVVPADRTIDGRIDVRISELAAKALEREIADGNWVHPIRS